MIRSFLPLCLVALDACAGKTEAPVSVSGMPQDYRPALRSPKAPGPIQVVEIPTPMPVALIDASKEKPIPRDKRPPRARVDAANREALREPAGDGYRNAVQIYPYAEGALYRLYAAPERITDIMLQPGESVTSVAAGDTVRWTVGDTASGSGTQRRTHILIKPFAPGLSTNLVITTDRRAYHVAMKSTASTAMAAIRWTYPRDELIALQHASAEAARTAPAATGLAIDDLNFAYRIEGNDPPWRPIRVFDDGRQVFIEFSENIATGAAPPLFVLSAKGDVQLVNLQRPEQHCGMGRRKLAVQSDPSSDFERLPTEPLSVRIPMAVKLTGLSRSRIYEFIESGEIETFKIGASTFIPYDSLRLFVDSYRTRARPRNSS